MVDDNTSMVSWLERGPKNEGRLLVRLVSSAGVAGPVLQVAEGGKQGLGYPRIVQTPAGALAVWSTPDSKLQTGRIGR